MNANKREQKAPERYWLIPSRWGFLPQTTKPTKSDGVEYIRADIAATSMRKACVNKVKALFHNSEVNHSRWNEAITAVIKELSSLTLDQVKEKQ